MPETGSEPLFGMLSAGEHGADQGFSVGPHFASPAAEAIRRPFGENADENWACGPGPCPCLRPMKRR